VVYTPAPPGDPTGTPVTKSIDANGGTVTSADGKMALTIPAGALAAQTDITIQPITNTAPDGDTTGTNYRFEPDGTIFSLPVTLTFNLSDDELPAIDSALIATQGADGLWYSQPGVTSDPTAKTISVAITHFSAWARLQTLALVPRSVTIRTGSSFNFTAVVLRCRQDGACGSRNYEPTSDADTSVWSVNSVPGGNASAGTVDGAGSTGFFSAPSSVPNPNPSIVTLTSTIGTRKVIAVARAFITDKEIWTGHSDLTVSNGGKIHSSFTFVQTDSDPSVLIRHFNVQNGSVTITPPPSDPCTEDPLTHAIATDDGTLTVDYTANSVPSEPLVTGYGFSIWPATATCDGHNDPIQLAAFWFPSASKIADSKVVGPLNIQVSVDFTIDTPEATGKVHLDRFTK
jgi:hypothetical protein